MSEVLHTIIERDTYNSILYAVLGGLLLLSTFHIILYFQNRDRSYLLYSFYTFFSFLAYVPVTESGFLHDLSDYFKFDFRSKQLFTIIFNCFYFFFFAQFLKVKKKNKTWYKIITYPALLFIAIAVITFLLMKYNSADTYFDYFKQLFPFLITAQIILSFYILTKFKNKLKYYIVFGGIVLFICSILGEHTVRELPFLNLTKKMGDFIYYIGLFIENIAFSFALGHRQRITYRERVTFSKNYISEMRKNEELKDTINMENQKRLLIENEQIKFQQEISELKLSILQTQMNPHFIFNALTSIKYYILENNSDKAVIYLTKFSKIIRTILIASTMKEFTLDEELQTIQVYVDIENSRFNHEIDFTIHIAENINPENIKLPPMVLQPFIENCILHGIALVVEKKINVDIFSKDSHIEIQITDNGVGRKEAHNNQNLRKRLGKSLGTKIADEMLKNYFGSQSYKIEYHDLYEENIARGTKVVLQIPLP